MRSFPSHHSCPRMGKSSGFSPSIKNLEQTLKQHGFVSFICSSCDEVENGSFEKFRRAGLSATQNIQGQYSNDYQSSFAHIELIKQVRADEMEREKVAQAISKAIINSYSDD